MYLNAGSANRREAWSGRAAVRRGRSGKRMASRSRRVLCHGARSRTAMSGSPWPTQISTGDHAAFYPGRRLGDLTVSAAGSL